MGQIKDIARRFKNELHVYKLILTDHRTPCMAKWLLGLAIGYALLPFDIIPDFIPVLGQLDDLLIIPVLVIIAMKLIPPEIISDCRQKAGRTQHSL